MRKPKMNMSFSLLDDVKISAVELKKLLCANCPHKPKEEAEDAETP